jgi:hypothetical protein
LLDSADSLLSLDGLPATFFDDNVVLHNDQFFVTDRGVDFVIKMKEEAIKAAKEAGTFGPFVIVAGAEGGAIFASEKIDFLRPKVEFTPIVAPKATIPEPVVADKDEDPDPKPDTGRTFITGNNGPDIGVWAD